MSSYIPRSLLDQAKPETADPTYRMSMLPFATYPNADGSGEHLGFAVPGMIQEPMNALMRLIGTPSNPGTFTQGPGYGSNADDMRTLLETFLGGNATRGMGAVERAAPEIGFLDSLKGKYLDYMHPDEYVPIGGSRMVRDYAGGNPTGGMPLDPTVVSGLLNHHTPGFMGFPANSARGWTPSIVHSDQLPSLPGAVVAGAERQPSNALANMHNAAMDTIGSVSDINPLPPINFPIRSYHGQWNEHDLLPQGDLGKHFGTPEVASRFAKTSVGRGETYQDLPGHVYPVDLDFKNPLILNPQVGGTMSDSPGAVLRNLVQTGQLTRPEALDYFGSIKGQHEGDIPIDKLREFLVGKGYDGAVYRNWRDDKGRPSFVAMAPGTVRSATTGETLFANGNGLPSLWGSAVAGQQNPKYPNSLFTY